MKWNMLFALLLGLGLCVFPTWPKGDKALFTQLPILHEGRIKPLSTFAREHLLAFSGRTHITVEPAITTTDDSSAQKLSAIDWLMEVLLDPSSSAKRKVFKIPNLEVGDVLNLKESKSRLYSFNDISKALDRALPLFQKIQDQPEKTRSLLEKQLLQLYRKANVYLHLSRSMSLILPLFSYNISPSPIKGLVPHQTYSYLEILTWRHQIKQYLKQIRTEKFDALSDSEKALAILSFQIEMMAQDEHNSLLKMIPPQWKDNKELWHSPWDLIRTGRGTPASAHYIKSWKNLSLIYRTKNHAYTDNIAEQMKIIYQETLVLSKDFVKPHLLYMETLFNHFHFFLKSLLCYVLSFLLCLFSLLYKTPQHTPLKMRMIPILRGLAVGALGTGMLFHLTGLVFRMIIMGRPPVATLYESILFVAFVVVLCSLMITTVKKYPKGIALMLLRKRKLLRSTHSNMKTDSNATGIDYALITGSAVGAVLCFISFKYKGLESMELLVPVLNTNFWLASHVLCITIGYGFAILSSVMAHIYIFTKGLIPKDHLQNATGIELKGLASLYKTLNSMVFMALFFCIFGTILGGIWADQSWGRFWGWDPKENGALLIIMALLVLIHGRQGRIFKETGFALGLMLINIPVALSWFGVNLLGVGLHSYGFVSGAFYGLLAFCGAELILFVSGLVLMQHRAKK